MNAEHSQVEDDSCSARRVTYDLKFLFLAITLAALWIAAFNWVPGASRILLAIYALTFLFGCWKTRRAVLFLLPAMYLPYAWLLPLTFWSEDVVWYFVSLWCQTPVVFVEHMLGTFNHTYGGVLTVVLSLVVFFLALMAARASTLSALVASLIVAVLTIANLLFGLNYYRDL